MDEPENPKKSQSQVERWLSTKGKSAWWREAYDYIMAAYPDSRYYDVLLAVWMSARKSDRGILRRRDDFADFIGVSRAVTYQWQDRRPELFDRENQESWVHKLLALRFDASCVAEGDARLIKEATGPQSTPAWLKLFYQRARILKEELDLHHSVEEGEPVEYTDVTGDELQRIRIALMGETQTAGGGAPG